MRDPLLHFALYPVRNFSRSTQRPFDLAHGPELAEGLSTGGVLNPVRDLSLSGINPALRGGTPYGVEPGIILKSNPAAEQRGIISNGVNSPQKIFLLLPQFVRIIPLKFFTPNTDIKSKPNTTSTNSVYGAMQDGYVERFDQKISPRPSFPKRGITISPFGKGGIRGIL